MNDEFGARPFVRSVADRRLEGVAGGVAHYLSIDSNAVRLVWLLAVPFTGGLAPPAYFALWFLLPEGQHRLGRGAGVGARTRRPHRWGHRAHRPRAPSSCWRS